MPHSIEKIKSTLIGGGARPNLFQVDLTSFPGSGDTGYDSDSFSVLCKAAQLPASNVASIDVPFRGRIFKVCLLYTSPSPRDQRGSRMPSSA